MRLYIYHHCPFCLRTVMVANYKKLTYETVFMLNDDEETCYRLINARQVPILERDDGSALAESLDIAQQLDQLGDSAQFIRPASQQTVPYSDAFSRVSQHINALLYPRCLALGLPEFMSPEASQYFRHKKEQVLGKSFAQAMADSAAHIAALEQMLAQLPAPSRPSEHNHTLSWDDLLIYPTLRNLTMVAGLNFPAAINDYLHEVSELTATQLYREQAL